MTQHDCKTHNPDCFRCDLNTDEVVAPVLKALARHVRKELEESVRYVPKIQIDREYHGD